MVFEDCQRQCYSTMSEIKIPIVKLDGNRFQLSIDTRLYAHEAITAAIYKFSHLFYVYQQTDSSNQFSVNIIFESKEANDVNEIIPKEFCNELIDQQIRYNTNAQFGHIRDMIVKEAFKPVTK